MATVFPFIAYVHCVHVSTISHAFSLRLFVVDVTCSKFFLRLLYFLRSHRSVHACPLSTHRLAAGEIYEEEKMTKKVCRAKKIVSKKKLDAIPVSINYQKANGNELPQVNRFWRILSSGGIPHTCTSPSADRFDREEVNLKRSFFIIIIYFITFCHFHQSLKYSIFVCTNCKFTIFSSLIKIHFCYVFSLFYNYFVRFLDICYARSFWMNRYRFPAFGWFSLSNCLRINWLKSL